MSCIYCEDYAKRITNILRDEELKEKFENITGISVNSNIFICDPCCSRLLEASSFREKCIEVYSRKESNVKHEIAININTEESNEHPETEIFEEHLMEELIEEVTDPLSPDNESESTRESEDEDLSGFSRYRYRYTLNEKLNAVKVAEQIGNRKAEKLLSIGESCIRKWRGQKEEIMSQADLEKNRLSRKKPLADEILEIVPFSERPIPVKTSPRKPPRPRKSYTSSQKLEAVALAEKTGNRQAAKIYKIDESCIRKWRGQKDLLIKINKERDTKRIPNLKFPEIESRLKEFVHQKSREGIYLKPNEVKAESIKIAKELNITHFKGTSSYIFKFMERYRVLSRKPKDEYE